jgi:CheY-like chemotaxis protein
MAKLLLIVEDDGDIRANFVLLFEAEGFAVQACANGQLALDFLRGSATLPSLILLDLTMPVMDGFQFREAQLADPRLAAVPVVVVTADGNVEEKLRRTRANHLLRKPVDIDVLLLTVAKFAR